MHHEYGRLTLATAGLFLYERGYVQACLHCVRAGWCYAIVNETVRQLETVASFRLIVSFRLRFRVRDIGRGTSHTVNTD